MLERRALGAELSRLLGETGVGSSQPDIGQRQAAIVSARGRDCLPAQLRPFAEILDQIGEQHQHIGPPRPFYRLRQHRLGQRPGSFEVARHVVVLGGQQPAPADVVGLLGRRQARSMLVQLRRGLRGSSCGCLLRGLVELGRHLFRGLVASERQMARALLGAGRDLDQAVVQRAPALGGRLRVDDRGVERMREVNAIVGDLDRARLDRLGEATAARFSQQLDGRGEESGRDQERLLGRPRQSAQSLLNQPAQRLGHLQRLARLRRAARDLGAG